MHFFASRQVNASNWWLMTLQAIAAIIFGSLLMVWPKPTLVVFSYLFGTFVIVDGLYALGFAIARAKTMHYWWAFLLLGLFVTLVGILFIVFPHAARLFIAYLVATWALLAAIYYITNAFLKGNTISQRVVGGVIGVLSFALLLFILVNPNEGVLSFIWLL